MFSYKLSVGSRQPFNVYLLLYRPSVISPTLSRSALTCVCVWWLEMLSHQKKKKKRQLPLTVFSKNMLCVGVLLCVCVCVWIASIHSSLEIRCIPSLNNILCHIKVCVYLMFVCMSEVTPLTLKTTFVMFFFFFRTQTSNVPPYTHTYTYTDTHRVVSWGPQQVGTCPIGETCSRWHTSASDTPRPQFQITCFILPLLDSDRQ